MIIRLLNLLIAITVAASLVGCTSPRESYPGFTNEQVWNAMRAVAHDPVEPGWVIMENNAWSDGVNDRIEVRRHLRRDRMDQPGRVVRENRHQNLSIRLERGPTPVVIFTDRDARVPSHQRAAADAYFEDVWNLLGGRIERATPPPATERPIEESTTQPATTQPATTPPDGTPPDPSMSDDAGDVPSGG